MPGTDRLAGMPSRSAAVHTPSTPGTARASVVSMPSIVAWAEKLRT